MTINVDTADWSCADVLEEWSALSTTLMRWLVRCGSPADLAEDLVQEVAAALMARQTAAPIVNVLAWSRIAARRMLAAERRRVSCLDLSVLPETASADASVEDQVEARLELEAVARTLRSLSASDQRLLFESGLSTDPATRSAMYVRRHRLRQRLAASAARNAERKSGDQFS